MQITNQFHGYFCSFKQAYDPAVNKNARWAPVSCQFINIASLHLCKLAAYCNKISTTGCYTDFTTLCYTDFTILCYTYSTTAYYTYCAI